VKVILISSDTAEQLLLPVVVRVSVRLPELISLVVGEYVVLSELASGLYVPRPPDQEPPVATVTIPDRSTSALLAQSILSAPASAVGPSVKLTVISSNTALHVPFEVV